MNIPGQVGADKKLAAEQVAANQKWEQEALVANRHVKVADQVMHCPFEKLRGVELNSVQGYLAHENSHPPRTPLGPYA